MEKKRKLYLEALRLVAVFCVIFNHTGKYGFHYFTRLDPSPAYWLWMALAVVGNISVALFFMVTGATLLGKTEPVSVIWKKRIPRIALVILLFSLLQALLQGDFEVGRFLKNLYSKNVIVPYWYLYAYLAFLIMLPFFRRMVQGMTEREFIYLFFLYLIFAGVIPVAQYWLCAGTLTLNPSLDLALVTSRLVVYPAMGFWLSRRPSFSGKTLVLLWAGAVLGVVVTCCITHYHICLTGAATESAVGKFYKAFHILPALALFSTAKKLEEKFQLPRWAEKALVTLGGCTFGVYLLEQPLRQLTRPLRDGLLAALPDFPGILGYVTLVLLLGLGLTWCLKRLPGVKQLI